MYFLGPDRVFKLARIIDTDGADHRLNFLQDEIDGLYRARRLFGQAQFRDCLFLAGNAQGLLRAGPRRQRRRQE